jgi:hypothetical protein
MAKRGSGLAVGYIRGKLWKGKATPDAKLQRARLREFAEENEYEIIKIDGEVQKFKLGKETGFKKLIELNKICRKHRATFLYIDIGKWRQNIVLNQFVNKIKSFGEAEAWRYVAVPPNRKIIEAIERQDRMEKFESRRRPRKKKEDDIKKSLSPIEKWQAEFNIGRRRLKSFEHLYHGVEPIYQVIENELRKSPKIANKRIAWALDREAYLTVDGKRWTDETVRKVKLFIQEDAFLEFVRLKERDKDFKYDV